jgi:TrmH family RNA methyltransferase
MPIVSSPRNERVKLVRLLQSQAKARRRHRRLVLEGVRLIRDALQAGVQPDFVCGPADLEVGPALDLIHDVQAEGIPCLLVTGALLRTMTDTETPQGVLAVFPWPDLPVPAAPGLVLVADGWGDPGNLGTAIRSAAAAGVDLVTLTPGTVDPFNPKALRAGMGAHFRVPILISNWPRLTTRFPDLAIYLADATGDVPHDTVDWTRPSMIAVGGEAHGLRDPLSSLPHTRIRIPMVAGAESLNAAVAASLLIYEARRHVLREQIS